MAIITHAVWFSFHAHNRAIIWKLEKNARIINEWYWGQSTLK